MEIGELADFMIDKIIKKLGENTKSPRLETYKWVKENFADWDINEQLADKILKQDELKLEKKTFYYLGTALEVETNKIYPVLFVDEKPDTKLEDASDIFVFPKGWFEEPSLQGAILTNCFEEWREEKCEYFGISEDSVYAPTKEDFLAEGGEDEVLLDIFPSGNYSFWGCRIHRPMLITFPEAIKVTYYKFVNDKRYVASLMEETSNKFQVLVKALYDAIDKGNKDLSSEDKKHIRVAKNKVNDQYDVASNSLGRAIKRANRVVELAIQKFYKDNHTKEEGLVLWE